MAIYGSWQACAMQVRHHAGFETAFRFLQAVVEGEHAAAQTLASLPEGEVRRVDLDGERVYALLQHVSTRPREQQQLEAHRQYADVQFVLRGQEVIEVAPLDGLTVTQPFDAARDVALYAMPEEGTRLLMESGSCAILFPSDAHAPLQARGGGGQANRRVVVKVRDPLGA
jgi:biofilm protein TabA